MDEKIIISAPPEITKRILALLNELDKKPGRFRIYVRLISSADLQLEARAVEVSGRAGPIEVNKQSGVLPKKSGGKISVGGISYGASSNSIKGAGSNMQFVDALWFGAAEREFNLEKTDPSGNMPLKFAGVPEINRFQGNITVQIRIKEAEFL